MIPPTRAVLVQHVKRATYQEVMSGTDIEPGSFINNLVVLELVTAGMKHTGRLYPRQLTSVKNWCSANAERDV